jgi:hypothetical protein
MTSTTFKDTFINNTTSIYKLAIQKNSETDEDCIYNIHLTQTKLLDEILDSLQENVQSIYRVCRVNQKALIFVGRIGRKCDVWMDSLYHHPYKREDRKLFRSVMDKLDRIKETYDTIFKEIDLLNSLQTLHASPAAQNRFMTPEQIETFSQTLLRLSRR